MTRPRLLAASSIILLHGCFYVKGAWRPESDCEVYSCPDGYCRYEIVIDGQDLEDCYPPPTELPAVFLDYDGEPCEPGKDCVLVREGFEAFPDPKTAEALTESDADAICRANREWSLKYNSEVAITNLLAEINADCQLAPPGGGFLFCAPDGDPEYQAACTSEADTADTGMLAATDGLPDALPDAQYELSIEASDSYVHFDNGAESVYTSVRGVAHVAPNPKRVLRAFAWGQDFQYNGNTFTHNHVALSGDLQMAGSGSTYSIPVNQDFELEVQGYRNAAEYRVGLAPGVSSGGVFDPVGGVWSYDFSSAVNGQTLVIHLEGDVTSL